MIHVSHVSKMYRGNDTPALHDVNISVARGEFVFLTGPSGAGKSTLLRLIFAGDRATSGQILVDGKSIVGLKEAEIPGLRRKIGVVFQDFKLIPTQTVHENVEYPLHVLGLSVAEIRKRVFKILKGVGLFERATALPATLSGGEQQRVAIARALVHSPDILLADEPTGNLDEDTTADIMTLFEAASSRGATIVLATHDRAMIEHYRKRVVYLKKGMVQTGSLPERRRFEHQ